jgi:hypothetical protein
MTAYTATVTLDSRPGRLGNSPFGVVGGTCNLSNYNQTLAELTTITKAFLPSGLLRVVADGLSSNGYAVKWDTTGKAFKAYYTATPLLTTASGSVSHAMGVTASSGTLISDAIYTGVVGGPAAALTECASDVNVGTFNFMIVGQLG